MFEDFFGSPLPNTSWQHTAQSQCAASFPSCTFCMAVFTFLNNREIYVVFNNVHYYLYIHECDILAVKGETLVS